MNDLSGMGVQWLLEEYGRIQSDATPYWANATTQERDETSAAIIAELERRSGTHVKDTAKDIAAAQLRLQDWADNFDDSDEDGPPPPTAAAVATARAMLRVAAAMNQYRFRGISVGGDGEITISFEDDDGNGECFYANPSGTASWCAFDIDGNIL